MTPAAEDADAARLRALFDEQDRLERRLRVIRQCIASNGRAYWDARGCLAFPRTEALRRAVQQ